nr:F-box/FBD/LRR-repeat protein At5g44980-like [Ipomoea batatas]
MDPQLVQPVDIEEENIESEEENRTRQGFEDLLYSQDNQHSSQLHDLEVDESSFWNNFMSEVNHCVGNQDVSGTQLMYKNLSKAEKLQSSFNTFELVPTQERLSEMDSAWKSFINTHSTGYNYHGSKVGTVGWTTEYGWELDGLK